MFRSDQVAFEWLYQEIPAFHHKTPLEYAAANGLEALRLQMDRFRSMEVGP
jgi:hypothetical protein